MERFLGLSDFGIFPLIGFAIIIYLIVMAFKGNGKGGSNSNSGSSNTGSTGSSGTTSE